MGSTRLSTRMVAALLLGVLLWPAWAAAEQRVALVIGNGAYKELPLTNPYNDATDMADVLREAGFRVILKRDADTRELRNAVREFATELRRADVGLFYFAGHGVQLTGTNYLLPVGADIRSAADAEDLSLDVNYVLRTMEESQTQVRIVILDACRNNPYSRSFRSLGRGLAPITAATGSLVAFATAPGSLAADGEGRNGMYTKHLLASLRQPDTDILKVFQRTRAAVVRETGGRQTPWEATSLLGEFHFRPTSDTAPSAVAAPSPAAAPERTSGERREVAAAPAPTERETKPATAVVHSGLSYGGVTSQVQNNKTTQLELVQMFGGPSISTTDADGTEVWIYERAVTETERQNRSEGYQAAANLGVFFSAVQLGGGGSTGKSTSSSNVSTSFRSLTVIVKFNPNKTVKEYSVRASQF
ncbi:MAG: hypothetical protein E6H65_09000 [Betaproteobacteria bacterium]|nr:MAG: hypothetical protein E6H65_09000 [Betaproteobacteria bacterium]